VPRIPTTNVGRRLGDHSFVRVVLKLEERSGRTSTKERFMPECQPVSHDVVIAGAGPVGLFLACELRLAGCSVLVLEKTEDPRSPLKVLPFGLRGLSVPSAEAFDRRGLLDALLNYSAGGNTPTAAHRERQLGLGLTRFRGRSVDLFG
jgi:choline dehydrogenase-like flavoprotein